MSRRSTLATLALSGLLLSGVAATPALASGAQAPAVNTVSAASMKVQAATVRIHMDHINAGFEIARTINDLPPMYRDQFVEGVVNIAFLKAGRRYNVMMMNLDQDYSQRLTGTKLYATVTWDNVYYGLWISEAGAFTNRGDGGYINWGFRGWYTRDGMTVKFRRP